MNEPIMEQILEMMEFIGGHEKIYVYGCNHDSAMLAKFLTQCGARPSGFAVAESQKKKLTAGNPELSELERLGFTMDSVFTAPEIRGDIARNPGAVGFLLAGDNIYIQANVSDILRGGFEMDNLYVLSEFNKSCIAYKMTPRSRENFGVEINLVDHCNLNCQMCDHFAQLAKPAYLSPEAFKRDMDRLSMLFEKRIGRITLLGGEPLLHKQLSDFVRIARSYFPDTLLVIFTNGLLLKHWEHGESENLWKVCHDHNVLLAITIYPKLINLSEIEELASRYDVRIDPLVSPDNRDNKGIKKSVLHPFDLDGKANKYEFIFCRKFNACYVLRNGRVYPCPESAYHTIFNDYFGKNLKGSDEDSIDIYRARSWQEITAFATHRVPFCNYCRISGRREFDWARSKKDISEYT